VAIGALTLLNVLSALLGVAFAGTNDELIGAELFILLLCPFEFSSPEPPLLGVMLLGLLFVDELSTVSVLEELFVLLELLAANPKLLLVALELLVVYGFTLSNVFMLIGCPLFD